MNAIVCNGTLSEDAKVPAEVAYQNNGDVLNSTWGLSTTGVALSNGLTPYDVDHFYPADYGWVFSQNWVTDLLFLPDTNDIQNVDWCLAHPNAEGLMMYYSASTCVADKKYLPRKEGPMDLPVEEVMNDAYTSHLPYRSVLGISKDGRPIYTPLHGNGKRYDDCEVDICNGLVINGVYSYVSTMHHPYIMGCYGPGSKPENLNQACSTNPRGCNMAKKCEWWEWCEEEEAEAEIQ